VPRRLPKNCTRAASSISRASTASSANRRACSTRGRSPPTWAILKFAIFLGDNETFSITYAVESDDDELRKKLTDVDAFETVARALVPTAPWRADGVAEPMTDVHVMAGLRNRYRPLVDRNGAPIVHGFVAVGDASVCTNPLYGRGCSMAAVHAFGLADALKEHGTDAEALGRSFAEYTVDQLLAVVSLGGDAGRAGAHDAGGDVDRGPACVHA